MKKCPDCGLIVDSQLLRCTKCKYPFAASDRIALGSGNLGKLHNPPQKVRISADGELCWVPLYESQGKQLTNSATAQLARERAEAAKAQLEMRKAAEARREKN